jgi:hypothetical protein
MENIQDPELEAMKIRNHYDEVNGIIPSQGSHRFDKKPATK